MDASLWQYANIQARLNEMRYSVPTYHPLNLHTFKLGNEEK